MKIVKRVLVSLSAVAALAIALQLAAPRAVQAVVSALVTVSNTSANPVPTQLVAPANPFYAFVILDFGTTGFFGPGTGTLAVSNITVTNQTNATEEISVNQVLTTGSNCTGTITSNVPSSPKLEFFVPPQQTFTISYPTPIVFAENSGQTCVTVVNSGGAYHHGAIFHISGFMN